MKRLSSLCLLALLAGAAPVHAQPATPAAAPPAPDYSKVEEKVTDLGNGLYEITGAGGNTTVAVGSKGVLVVDTQFAPVYDKLRAAITGLSAKPVLYVVNTHYHGDHTGGNALFREKDHAAIVAAPQVAEHLSHPPPTATGAPGVPAPADALPTAPYSGSGTTLDVGGMAAQLVHPAIGAHTDGDTIILFSAANVISSGDLFVTNGYPNIDVVAGGSIDGIIAAVDFLIAHANATTKIVPGHGNLASLADLQAYRAMVGAARDRIAKAKAQGMTEQQVVDANLLSDFDARWKVPGNAISARFPINVYRSLK